MATDHQRPPGASGSRRAHGTARPMGRVEKLLRVGLYFLAFGVSCLWFEAALRIWAQGASLLDPSGRVRRFNALVQQWGRLLCELTLRLLCTRLEVVGEVPAGRFIVVSNHQSTADIAILIWLLREQNCKFVAKRELGRFIPAVSCALSRGGAALIARDPTREDLGRLRSMARSMECWEGSPVVFAEGTRSRDGSVLPYRSAAVRVLVRHSGLPILPVAVDGTHVAADLPGFARDLPGSCGTVHVGRPIPAARAAADCEAVVQEVRAWAVERLAESRRSKRPAEPRRASAPERQAAEGA